MANMHEELDKDLDSLRFDEALKQRVRAGATSVEREKPRRRISHRALTVAAVCAALVITACAAAAPSLLEFVKYWVGSFDEYVVPVKGAAVEDDGIRMEVLGAMSDGTMTRVYVSFQDLEGDRLGPKMGGLLYLGGTTFDGRDYGNPEVQGDNATQFMPSGAFKVLSYDAPSRTAVVELYTDQVDTAEPVWVVARSILSGYQEVGTTYLRDSSGQEINVPLMDVGAQPLRSETVNGITTLAHGQNPVSLGQEGISISSMGFASDGVLHVRMKTEPGSTILKNWLQVKLSVELPQALQNGRVIATELPDGMDYAFAFFTTLDVQRLKNAKVKIWGLYCLNGDGAEGKWDIEIPVETVETRVLDWNGQALSGAKVGHDRMLYDVESITISPLGVKIESTVEDYIDRYSPDFAFHIYRKDGSLQSMSYSSALISGLEKSRRVTFYYRFDAPQDLDNLGEIILEDRTEIAIRWK